LSVEGIRLDDIGAGCEILLVDVLDDLWLGQHEEIVVALHVARPIGEAGPAIVGFLELVTLDHGAHGAVDDEDALGGGLFESGVAGKAFHTIFFQSDFMRCDFAVGRLPLTPGLRRGRPNPLPI